MHFWVYGDDSGCGCSLYINDAKDEVHKYRISSTKKIDFTGWREIIVDLSASHEIWGGDKNRKIDYPITGITFEISQNGKKPIDSKLYFDDLSVESEKSARRLSNIIYR